jgi:chromosome segregation protein SMC/fructose-1,6-bisphosphatase class II
MSTVDRILEHDFIRVTEAAAIAAAQTMGQGDRKNSDHVAVEAMRREMDTLPIAGRIVIGEGERDEAPMLFVGEEVGARKGMADGLGVDIAVDPLEGTNLCATGAPDATAVLAAAERGGLLHAPDSYMEKLIVGPTAKGRLHLDAPVAENLRALARAFDRDVEDLTVIVLERPRHQQLIADIRTAGARIRLIGDGDLSAGIACAVRGTGVHAVMGTGGAPEGVLTAAAMRCLNGEIYARLVVRTAADEARCQAMGIADTKRVYRAADLAPGRSLIFAATGVTDGSLMKGVRFFGDGIRTQSLIQIPIRLEDRTAGLLTLGSIDPGREYSVEDYRTIQWIAQRMGLAIQSSRLYHDAQREIVAGVQQQIQVAAAEMRGVDEQASQAESRRDRLVAEEKGLAPVDPERLDAARQRAAEAEAAHHAAEARLAEWQERVPALDDARRALQAAANDEAHRHADLAARLGALKALQEKVQIEDKLMPWLARHGLESLPGLWRRIRIEPGWEPALEAALRERLGSLEIGRLDTVRAFAADAPPARLAFFTTPSAPIASEHRTLPRLTDLLHLGDSGLTALLGDWLEGVYTATDLDAALAARSSLTHGEVIMTREGHAVSQFAVSFYAPDSQQAGLLARAQEIENLEKQTRAQAILLDEAKSRLVRAEAESSDAAERLAASRNESAAAQSAAHQQQVELLRLTQLAEQASQRREQLSGERVGLEQAIGELSARRAAGESRFEALDAELGVAQERHAELDESARSAERALAAVREEGRALERQAQEAQFEQRSLVARAAELARSIETALQQLEANRGSDVALAADLERLTDAEAEGELQAALAKKLERESALGERRSVYDDLSQRLRAADKARLGHEHALQPLRDRVGALQLEEQAAQLGGAQYLEQLETAGADREAVGRGVEEGNVKLAGLQGRIDALNREIESLGAVNLAALEELGQARERKGFLDAQNTDLTEAMTTLEDAIRKIDLETRELLGTTFEQVNEHFGRMFPTLFGGGTARLVMTGDEILDAGVQVMAQPPGKKNSSIHLLSGGEKALAAIALVFAIFQLNPAPFCLLDEVDAPLDDANTERYAKLVTEMSKVTQFLFISHNRIAMEMAEQLIGVTMQEQGVSRIVTVDMPSAMRLAEAA